MTQISRTPRAVMPPGDDRLRSACRQVEGLFIAQLLAAMDRPAWGEGALGSSAESRMFAAQRNRELAADMGRRGELGLADMLYRELSRSGADAAPEHAPAGRTGPLTEGDAD